MEIKEVRRALGISNTDIARMFGYKNKKTFQNSSAKKRIEKGIVQLYQKFRDGNTR